MEALGSLRLEDMLSRRRDLEAAADVGLRRS